MRSGGVLASSDDTMQNPPGKTLHLRSIRILLHEYYDLPIVMEKRNESMESLFSFFSTFHSVTHSVSIGRIRKRVRIVRRNHILDTNGVFNTFSWF